MSLAHFEQLGWAAEVVTVKVKESFLTKDENLIKSVPKIIKIHYVKALPYKITKYLGLGSIALRSMIFYYFKVSKLISLGKIDLVYFSTTQFPVCVLGYFWKKRYGVSYVIDMQDPWHSDYYRNRPKAERPPKYWFSYYLNKWLEPVGMKLCDGLISVSQSYLDTLFTRYPHLKSKPASVITFGVSELDMEIARQLPTSSEIDKFIIPNKFNITYVGVCGNFMHKAIKRFFLAVKKGYLESNSLFNKLNISFIGTSYAPSGVAKKNIYPIALELGIEKLVFEQTDRISYYEVFQVLEKADALFIPGVDDPGYTASKLYPYMLAEKPILSIFHPESNAINIVQECMDLSPFTLDADEEIQVNEIYELIRKWLSKKPQQPKLNFDQFSKYMSFNMAKRQVDLFNQAVK